MRLRKNPLLEHLDATEPKGNLGYTDTSISVPAGMGSRTNATSRTIIQTVIDGDVRTTKITKVTSRFGNKDKFKNEIETH